MRLFAVALLAALACTFAASVSAKNRPPAGLSSIRIVKISAREHNAKTCAAQSRSRSAAAKRARKLNPVACEFPPRSKLLDAGFAIFFGA